MSTTTPTRKSTAPEIASFAAAVRTALADLPPEELDDLTDGLEADLAERAADADDKHPADLGDPSAYAEELRAAAGYPPRSARSHLGGTLPSLRSLPQELLRRWNAFRAEHAWVTAVVTFFVTLRPVWWVLRGWAVYSIIGHVFGGTWAGYGGIPGGPVQWATLFLVIFISVQLGRGRWLRREWQRTLLVIASAALALGLPSLVANAAQDATDYAYNQYSDCCSDPGTSAGLTDNGQQVTNIFAYDAQGNPIPQVQLFDQDGKPLNLVGDASLTYAPAANGDTYVLVPNGDVPGRSGWNVYPLARAGFDDLGEDGTMPSDVTGVLPVAPFGTAKPLSGSEPAATSTASPSPTPSPTPGH